MKRSRIAASAIIVATIVSASVFSGLWMGGYLSPKKTEKKPFPPNLHGFFMIFDVTGYRENSSESDITCVTFLASVRPGDLGIDIADLQVLWLGSTQTAVLELNESSPTTPTSSTFATDEVPVKSPRSVDWDPSRHPPKFHLYSDRVIYINIDLTSSKGIDDQLGPGKTAQVYFEGLPGLSYQVKLTTPDTYGTSRLIDLTPE